MTKLLVFCALCLTVACSKSAPPPGQLTPLENACNGADGARLRMSGYLRYRRGLLSFCSNYGSGKTCDMALYAAADRPPDWDPMRPQKGPEPVHADLSVPVGDDPGEMSEMPKRFKDSDIVLHLPDKATATEGSRITIDGTLSVVPEGPKAAGGAETKHCWVKVEWASPS